MGHAALDAIAASMSADVSRLATLGHNLANTTTPGYKREVARAHDAFSALLHEAGGPPSGPRTGAAIDLRPGSVQHTGRALDVAIDTAMTFLEVQTPEGPAYTRRGDLRLDELGQLCDHAGHPVMGTGGLLALPSAEATLDADGTLRVAGEAFGRLRLVQFARPESLQRAGGSLYRADATAEPVEASQAKVRQRHLEVSNVDSASEMVALMETLRHFEAGQKVLQGIDDMHERALRKLGEF